MTTSNHAKQPIPDAEDLPLILAWIKHNTDPLQKCEARQGKCQRIAKFAIDEYEDKNVIEEAIRKSHGVVNLKALEEIIWQNTMKEQMQDIFTIHSVYHMCLEHQLLMLKHFLNTQHEQDLRMWLTDLPAQASLVQFHLLSYPENGLVAPTLCKTPQEFMKWMKSGVRIDWKV